MLLDAYTAGANAHLFADERLRAATKLEYPRSYGFVLSGGLKSVAAEFKSYIRTEEDRILGILKNSTEPMGVSHCRKRIADTFYAYNTKGTLWEKKFEDFSLFYHSGIPADATIEALT